MARPKKDRGGIERRKIIQGLLGSSTLGLLAGCQGQQGGGGGGGGGGAGGGGGGAGGGGGGAGGGGGGGTPSGGGGGGGGSMSFMDKLSSIAWEEKIKDRRMYKEQDARFEAWPMETRLTYPPQDQPKDWAGRPMTTDTPWVRNIGATGWDETEAADVDTIQIDNFGALQFDPATVHRHEMVTEATGIDFDYITTELTTALPKQQAYLGARQPSPHAINVELQTFSTYVNNGWTQSINPVMQPDADHWKWYPDGAQTAMVQQGNTEMAPQITNMHGWHVRADLLEEQGLDRDMARYDSGWTWKDLEEIMKAFKGTDLPGFAHHGKNDPYIHLMFMMLCYTTGATFLQGDSQVPQYDQEPMRKVLNRIQSWRENGLTPNDVTAWGQGDLTTVFKTGRAAVTYRWTSFARPSMNEFGDDYYLTVPPKADFGPDPAHRTLWNPNLLAINPFADDAHKLAAALVSDVNFSFEHGWTEYTYEGNLSYRNDVYPDATKVIEEKPDAMQPWLRRFNAALNAAQKQAFIETWPFMNSLNQTAAENLSLVVAGEREPNKALKNIQSKANTLIGG